MPFRVISLLAAYNEELYIAACLEHLEAHGVHAYLIDNESTDRTLEIAKQFLNRNLIAIETMPRRGVHILGEKLKRKEELAQELDADWFIHQDLDEFRLPLRSDGTLAQALARVDAEGYNAVNFDEHVFVPTREEPNHEHANFQNTMRHYYSLRPRPLHRLNAWKKQSAQVDLHTEGGHRVEFPNLKMYPASFKMRHYHFLSIPHAIRKFVGRPFVQTELDKEWHGWRPQLRAEMISELPSQSELIPYESDDALEIKNPRAQHYLGELVVRAQSSARIATLPRDDSCVIITGMHRSGTSLTANLLQRAGLNLGENLNPPAPDNPRGYFENLDVVQFHDDLLRVRGETIFPSRAEMAPPTARELARGHELVAQLAAQNIRACKDPRAALFLNVWESLLPNARYVLLFRSPLDVLFSLMRRRNRDMNGLLEALDAWTLYNQNILSFYARHANDAVLCEIDALVAQPETSFQTLTRKLKLELQWNAQTFDEIFHAAELHHTELVAPIVETLATIHPDALHVFAELRARADISQTPTETTAIPPHADLVRPLQRAELLRLCATLEPALTEQFFSAAPPSSLHEQAQQIDSLQETLRTTRERLGESMTYVQSLEQTLVNALLESANGKTHIASLTEALEQTRAQRAEAEQYARSLQETLAQAQQARATAEQHALSLQATLEQTRAAQSNAEAYARALQETLAEKEIARANAEQHASSLQATLEQTRAVQGNAETYARSLQETLAQAQQARANTEQHALSLRDTLEQTRAQRAEAEQHARSLQITLEQLQVERANTAAYVQSLRDTLEQTRAYLKQSEEYARSLEHEIEKMRTPVVSVVASA